MLTMEKPDNNFEFRNFHTVGQVCPTYCVKPKKNFSHFSHAFTLAEVIIVLGIIGILAEITIPTLINNVAKQVRMTQFKQVYSELSQAYLLSYRENGTSDGWTSQKDFYNNIKPYLNIVQDCPLTQGCFVNSSYKYLDGRTWVNFYTASWYKLRLKNGGAIAISCSLINNIWVDINGDSPPNQQGYDVFEFNFTTKNGAPIVLWGSLYTDLNHCKKSVTSGDNGRSCSYWVLKHWNMDYLEQDLTSAEWNN